MGERYYSNRDLGDETDFVAPSEPYCPQKDIMAWQSAVGADYFDFPSQMDKKAEEDQEVLEAYMMGDPEALREELVDCVIVSVGMLGLLGVDIYSAIQDKMAITWEKYAPDKIGELTAQGMTREEAFAQMKRDWQVTHPKPEIGGNGEQPDMIQLSLSI